MSDREMVHAELDVISNDLWLCQQEFKRQCAEPDDGTASIWQTPRDPYAVRDASGRIVLADILAARGQVLAAIARLV